MGSQLIELGQMFVAGAGMILLIFIGIAGLDILLRNDFIRKHLGAIVVILMLVIGCILILIGHLMKG